MRGARQASELDVFGVTALFTYERYTPSLINTYSCIGSLIILRFA